MYLELYMFKSFYSDILVYLLKSLFFFYIFFPLVKRERGGGIRGEKEGEEWEIEVCLVLNW